ncbi:GNAT family N-acetyltransferase [Novosphingobium rosa]|uniref:GNAT family N-acetyltransferase n=1 Tax=Novosphingobium rosa TaxID=76978 RepID=UPI00082DE8AB|nr:GNAT family N-acetyltransferase [Novosphingobium rosa]
MIPDLETERLLLRPVVAEDAPAVQKQFPDWRIVEFLNPLIPWPYPADGAETFLRDVILPRMASGAAWQWSIRLKSAPDRLVGVISLQDGEQDNRGFWLNPDLWGQGLMGEACEAVTAFWFETLAKPVLRVPKAMANIASRRISEKTGMRVIWQGERDFVSGRHPTEIWEITREEWLALRGR